MDFEQARFNMIEQQIRPWNVLDTEVLDIIQSVPRELFVPNEHKNLAFADLEIPLGHGQVMMSPKVEARLLQELQLNGSEDVLEVGTGSGYLAACLAAMTAHVTTIEYYEDLSSTARQHCELNDVKNVEFIVGNIFDQLSEMDTYDTIAVTSSVPEYTPEFAKHLNIGGRLFLIVGQRPVMSAMLVTCVAENEFRRENLFETEITPLIASSKKREFLF